MRKLAPIILAFLLAGSLSTTSGAGKIFSGEIMDSQCATMGSHDAMMKGMHAANARDCTQQCVKMGGKYVLYNAANKETYQLDDQQKPAAFAGEKVKVTGDLKGTTIHVQKIEKAS